MYLVKKKSNKLFIVFVYILNSKIRIEAEKYNVEN